jgi:hypothetical protein
MLRAAHPSNEAGCTSFAPKSADVTPASQIAAQPSRASTQGSANPRLVTCTRPERAGPSRSQESALGPREAHRHVRPRAGLKGLARIRVEPGRQIDGEHRKGLIPHPLDPLGDFSTRCRREPRAQQRIHEHVGTCCHRFESIHGSCDIDADAGAPQDRELKRSVRAPLGIRLAEQRHLGTGQEPARQRHAVPPIVALARQTSTRASAPNSCLSTRAAPRAAFSMSTIEGKPSSLDRRRIESACVGAALACQVRRSQRSRSRAFRRRPVIGTILRFNSRGARILPPVLQHASGTPRAEHEKSNGIPQNSATPAYASAKSAWAPG